MVEANIASSNVAEEEVRYSNEDEDVRDELTSEDGSSDRMLGTQED